MDKVHLDELIQIIEKASEEYGNLEVVFVGDDDEFGQYLQTHLDVAVCTVASADGEERKVFALMVNPHEKLQARRTLMQ